ncbi:glycosyltransferase [Nocardioides sp. SYSU D00038]|uniref:glycosyltransferase n=1 Tax=Nocardioides sp. SYSU D00038 TaxID=2812554 RepID=UPI0019686B37|nr:glycosyltransferase [Nocardioides sp. SYSU D00038]
MIGYYVHHHGLGHLHRALQVADALGEPVTALSSLPRPADWTGPWIELDRDDEDPTQLRPSAGDRLHWAPLGSHGLRSRMAEIASWIRHLSPRVVVVDVSVEVLLLVRLHGIPVVTVVQPGDRGDPAHLLGYDVADALVGCWPASARGLLRGVPGHVLDRVDCVGAMSRAAVSESSAPVAAGPRRATLLSGIGGSALDRELLDRMVAGTPGWEWTVLDRRLGTWVDDPAPVLAASDVVVTHAGQNALAEVAAARCPAVVVPQERPHGEQRCTAAVLAGGPWPVVVRDSFAGGDWAATLEQAGRLDGRDWASWCDGGAAARFAEVVRATALRCAS